MEPGKKIEIEETHLNVKGNKSENRFEPEDSREAGNGRSEEGQVSDDKNAEYGRESGNGRSGDEGEIGKY
ncbi:MAG TPA: hypothetical protein VF691_11315 [Cytophagaceae bacterium]|jgi:hypothetical protein